MIFINKKVLFASLLAVGVIGLSACGQQTVPQKPIPSPSKTVEKKQNSGNVSNSLQNNTNSQPTAQSNPSANQVNNVQLTSNNYKQSSFTLIYPQISGLSDIAKQNAINEIIKTGFKKGYEDLLTTDPNAPALTGDAQYEVTFQSPDILSIKYTGYLDFGGMHPNNFINGTTIDIKTGKQLNLSDITSVNANLIEHIKTGKYISPKGDEGNTDLKNAVLDYVKKSDNNSLLQNINQTGYFYLTSKSLVIFVPVSHALNDYAAFEISLNGLPNFLHLAQ